MRKKDIMMFVAFVGYILLCGHIFWLLDEPAAEKAYCEASK